MRDVARLAQVSTSTVSAVINGNVPVTDKRKARVLEAMAGLDYHPDSIARSLKTGRSNTIGVVVPDITNAFYPEVVRGVEEAAQLSGYSVLLCDSNEDPLVEQRHLSVLSSRRVDGVLLACCVDSVAYETMARRKTPVVFVDRLPQASSGATVSTDNVGAGYLATRHLIDLGHERIGMVAGHLGLSPHRDRLEGFRKAMQESGLPVIDRYLVCGGVQVEDGLSAGHRIIDLLEAPTALMVSNNKLLLGILQAIDQRNITVPEQLSLLGFDDYLWNRYFSPTLTAVAQSTHEIGSRAFRLLLEMIEGQSPAELIHKDVRLPAELKVRRSTARVNP